MAATTIAKGVINTAFSMISKSALILTFGIVVLQILLRISHHPNFICHDVAMYVQCTQLVLEGKVPYVDFVEINSPINFYVFICPVWLSTLLHLKVPVTVNLFLWLIVVLSLLCSRLVIHNRLGVADFALLTAVLFSFTILNLLLFFHFGQREHIFVLLFMPFFLMRWLRRENQSFGLILSVICGVAAATAITLKPPYYLPFAAAIEIYWLIVKRGPTARLRDSEMISCAIASLLFLLWFISWPQMSSTFINRWVPLILAGSGAYFCSLPELLFLGQHAEGCMVTVNALAIVSLIAIFIHNRHTLIMPLLVWIVAGYLIYTLQLKGAVPHTILFVAGYFMLANLQLALLAKWISERRLILLDNLKLVWGPQITVFAMYLCFFCCFSPLLIRDSFITGKILETFHALFAEKLYPYAKVFVVSKFVRPQYPCLVQLNARPASRYNLNFPLFMYAYLLEHTSDTKLKKNYELEGCRIISEICNDLRRTKPSIIAVSSSAKPLWGYFYQNGLNSILKNYRPLSLYNGGLVWINQKANTLTSPGKLF